MSVIKINEHKQDPDPSLVGGCITAVMALILAAGVLLLQGLWYGGLIFVIYKVLVFFGLFA